MTTIVPAIRVPNFFTLWIMAKGKSRGTSRGANPLRILDAPTKKGGELRLPKLAPPFSTDSQSEELVYESLEELGHALFVVESRLGDLAAILGVYHNKPGVGSRGGELLLELKAKVLAGSRVPIGMQANLNKVFA